MLKSEPSTKRGESRIEKFKFPNGMESSREFGLNYVTRLRKNDGHFKSRPTKRKRG